MFGKVLIANRGEIVGRVARTLKRMGIRSVAVASEADRFNRAVLEADEHVVIGPAPAAESYLDIGRIVDACRRTGAEAVHPGYGFLSENVAFAQALAAEGIVFIGPRPEHLSAFGLKHTARALAAAAGVPLLPGSGLIDDLGAARSAAAAIGYPVMLKSTAGGGGIGMQLCRSEADLAERFAAVKRMAAASFGDARVYLERFVETARHIEVQIFGNGRGAVVALGERDCSLQRRNQKVVEETPAPGLSEEARAALLASAVALGRSVSYESAGTVEYVYDVGRGAFSFLEVNTRLQVEHPVTEAVTGIDLVEWMIRQAAGEDVLATAPPIRLDGAAIEVRLYAEDALQGFRPSAGRLTAVRLPQTARVDGWIETGSEVTPFYDPMLAKLIVTGQDRAAAVAALGTALAETEIAGIETNLAFLRAVAASAMFREGTVSTAALGSLAVRPQVIEVIAPGAQSSLQELPGRIGLWPVGVPPSGPMDARSFRLANRIVGNEETAAALELTMSGPALRFHAEATIGLAGAEMDARLDGVSVPRGRPVAVGAGQTLALGPVAGPGQRAYLAVRGAFTAPEMLGSRATFALGGFGGHATGTLKPGDALHFGAREPVGPPASVDLPTLSHDWTLAAVYGPHGAPDFFTARDVETLFSTPYEVHFNSARTGVRLVGPKPDWARTDGGEAGLHPSNLHDNAYAVGAIDFTGDTPIILGPDGPSLGGFVCPAVVADEDLWKIGQLKPGDTIRFVPAARPEDPVAGPAMPALGAAVVGKGPAEADVPVVYRRQGDANLLVEYGPMTLDIGLRLRVHALMEALEATRLPGIVELTPGIRSLQIHYDPDRLSRTRLVDALAELEAGLPRPEAMTVPSRIVHLPLSWNDPEVRLAMRKYQELVRANAPWCPDNIEFIRRINGLPDETAVKETILAADYLVMGLGDVYLGAPVATPLDPRHRLVTTKYNPARTWTPENAVGIGGAYLCIYGMEGPGGYQLFGRTIQMWNSWRATPAFEPGKPWLLRFFDRIRFFLVDEAELAEARAAFPHGAYPVAIEETRFSYADHLASLAAAEPEIRAAKGRQQTAFEAERARWKVEGLDGYIQETAAAAMPEADIPEGCTALRAHVPGSVWKLVAGEGARVAAGDAIVVLESMKMEITVPAAMAGRVRQLRVAPGGLVRAGDIIAVMETEE
ncbi:5-oxoprolinase/urea amidolyase family protein [Prosthecomicrobium pneumaticum]|uniref:Urea carboxylase n=1 Tax=Prosthecomicrobium pneumaticum TaxID=81895 RepID=A0A7W9L3S4_9HYPH|nr:5-oxoprolinase/urea amidolyase family protein [Prosthecomicrobium pneumaticum]MBB5754854.1 urea carboxylase [Prosthecomicrobium pneumaticum]